MDSCRPLEHPDRRSRLGGAWILAMAAGIGLVPAPATAQSDEIRALRAELDALRQEQRRADARIAELEGALRTQVLAAPPANPTFQPAQQLAGAAPSPNPLPAAAPVAAPGRRLQLSGDFRLRYESNFSDRDARDRDRGVLRARLRAAYQLSNWLTLGGQIATGDPDDPNSSDITLSNFDDDLQVSLDQAYARLNLGDLTVHAGKIPQPFVRTELVWDGDVSPQGLSAAYRKALPGGGAVKATGLYFLVDEAVAGPNSDMAGFQFGFETTAKASWRLELAAAYYDYSLRSMAGGDTGDFRSNRLRGDGRYLSDFNLADAIAAITYNGLGERWPVRLVGDYVKNLGARSGGDAGFGIDLIAGRGSRRGDWRFSYGYAEAGVDAVLAAFSQDNTNIGTNYLQHMIALDYALKDNIYLNATFYHYRPKDPLFAGSNMTRDWLNRLRLNLLMNF
jgi:hypothetical protein